MYAKGVRVWGGVSSRDLIKGSLTIIINSFS